MKKILLGLTAAFALSTFAAPAFAEEAKTETKTETKTKTESKGRAKIRNRPCAKTGFHG